MTIGSYYFGPEPGRFGLPLTIALVHRSTRRGPDPRPEWFLDSKGEWWVDVRAESWAKHPETDKVLKTALIAPGEWLTLDWTGTALVSPNLQTGWLDPEGVMHGCLPVEHEAVAALYFRSNAYALAETFVRVTVGHYYAPRKGLTAEQRQWLKLRGMLKPLDEVAYERAELGRWVEASGRPLKPSGSGG